MAACLSFVPLLVHSKGKVALSAKFATTIKSAPSVTGAGFMCHRTDAVIGDAPKPPQLMPRRYV